MTADERRDRRSTTTAESAASWTALEVAAARARLSVQELRDMMPQDEAEEGPETQRPTSLPTIQPEGSER